MKYRQLGRTGLKVSELCLGTMTFGSNFFEIAVVSQREADQMVTASLDAGLNFFDTADVYSFGEAEEILGRALKEAGVQRNSVIIATKVMMAMSQAAMEGTGDINNRGLSRQHILASCEASLRRLDTDYIDLFQVHGWDPVTPIEETLRTLDDLVRQGKVRYLGCSNWAARHLAKALALAAGRGWESFVTLQTYYSLLGRDLEHELLPLCQEEGLGILPWSPLAGGFLTGKYRREQEGKGRRSSNDFPPLDLEQGHAVIDALQDIAQAHHVSVARVALAWILAQPMVSSVIIGASKVDQLEDNLKASDLELTPEQVTTLSSITQPRTLYPAWMIELQNNGR